MVKKQREIFTTINSCKEKRVIFGWLTFAMGNKWFYNNKQETIYMQRYFFATSS